MQNTKERTNYSKIIKSSLLAILVLTSLGIPSEVKTEAAITAPGVTMDASTGYGVDMTYNFTGGETKPNKAFLEIDSVLLEKYFDPVYTQSIELDIFDVTGSSFKVGLPNYHVLKTGEVVKTAVPSSKPGGRKLYVKPWIDYLNEEQLSIDIPYVIRFVNNNGTITDNGSIRLRSWMFEHMYRKNNVKGEILVENIGSVKFDEEYKDSGRKISAVLTP